MPRNDDLERKWDRLRRARANDMGDGAGFGVKGEGHPEPRWRIIFWLTVRIELGQPHMEGGRLVLPIDFGI